MNLITDESLEPAWYLYTNKQFTIAFDFEKVYQIYADAEKNEIKHIRQNIYQVRFVNTLHKTALGIPNFIYDDWLAEMRRTDFIDLMKPALEEPFVYLFSQLYTSLPIAQYLFENREFIKTQQDNVLIYGENIYSESSGKQRKADEILNKMFSMFGKSIPAFINMEKRNDLSNGFAVMDTLYHYLRN